MKKPYYDNYVYIGTEFVGIRLGKKTHMVESINERLYEDFINNYSFIQIYGVFKTIQEKMCEYKVSGTQLRKCYLNLLLEYNISHMSIYMNENEPVICRLDCLTRDSFNIIMYWLEIIYRSDTMRAMECKLRDFDKFSYEGI